MRIGRELENGDEGRTFTSPNLIESSQSGPPQNRQGLGDGFLSQHSTKKTFLGPGGPHILYKGRDLLRGNCWLFWMQARQINQLPATELTHYVLFGCLPCKIEFGDDRSTRQRDFYMSVCRHTLHFSSIYRRQQQPIESVRMRESICIWQLRLLLTTSRIKEEGTRDNFGTQ